jgi:hypothetical protein
MASGPRGPQDGSGEGLTARTRSSIFCVHDLRAIALVALAIAGIGLTGCTRHPARGPVPGLAGLPGVEVQVFRIQDWMIRAIVPEESLQTDFEARVRSEGIRALTSEERLLAPGEPQLWVLFKAVEVGPGQGCAFGVDLYLIQSVQLSRDPARTMRAITWNSRSGIGTMPDLTLEGARRAFDPAWSEFLAAYRSANR